MLKKLLKYDLKYIFKSQLTLYIYTLIFGILMDLCYLKIGITIFDIIYIILAFITFALLFSILTNNILKLWSRFINNIYKDEAYLTHTLPVTKNAIYLSKILTSIITLFASISIIILMLLIMSYPLNGINSLREILSILTSFTDSVTTSIISIFIIFGIEIIHLIQIGYTGIILGHRKNNNKMLYSLVYGTICYVLISVLSLLVVYILGLLNPELLRLFKESLEPTRQMMKLLVTCILSLYIFIIIIFYLINTKLLKKGVNID